MASRFEVAILAGGQSRRMGTDKRFILLDGRPMIQHVIDRVGPLGCPIMLIAPPTEAFRAFGLPVYPDAIAGAGALGGLHTALTHSRAEYTLCLACDMPLVNADLLRFQMAQCDGCEAVVPRTGDTLHGLHALYRHSVVAVLERRIRAGQLSLHGLIESLQARIIDEAELSPIDPDGTSLINLNTPQDVARWFHLGG